MAQFTDFGKEVKHRLIDMDRTQAWLIDEIRTRTGKYMDQSYMNKILTGTESGASIIPVIREVLGLEGSA